MTALAGTGSLVRLALRRDRLVLPIWIAIFALIMQSGASTFAGLYDTAAERASLIASISGNPTFTALYGNLHGDSSGALLAWRYGATISVAVALMSMLIVVRHTRAEEESGRLELVSSGIVGRLAPLSSALAVVYGADLVIGGLFYAIVAGAGYGSAGSLAFAAQITATGMVFATIAGLTAQLTESARLANGLTGITLGVSYLLRALGDTAGENGPAWLTWLSPIGWGGEIRSFAGDRWWILLLFAGLIAATAAGAYVLNLRRDFAAGLIAQRPGPAQAASGLRSPLALAWRLQRGVFYGWCAAFLFLGVVFGGVANGVEDIFGGNPDLMEVLRRLDQGDIVDIYMTMIMGLIALIVSVYSVQATLRLRSEETGLLAEPVLATAVSRVRWAAGHLVLAVLGPAVLLTVSGLALGLTYGAAAGDVGGRVGAALKASLVQLPAVWVLTGLALALFGLLPRLTMLAWAALTVFVLLGQLGPVLQLDQWAMDLSPFTHVPAVGGGGFTAVPLIWLVAIAIALTAASLFGLRRRDLATAG